ncbi:hypothetical protein Cgig2_017588 [Carnegiea gigantea]|uniref:Thioredoxin domain-containing protein n=1 Tax=Carnegiea gigantea TaxID=171969 RepID=A0A9Q1QLL5_9CARY|nr:hypothetical protein Cgig2_017588 [Carnegiea gigantea]
MSRFSALRSCLLRHHHRYSHSHSQRSLIHQRLCPISLSSSLSSLISPLRNTLPQITPSMPLFTLTIPGAASLASSHSTGFRSFSSDSDLPSNMVLVKSEDQLNGSLKKVEDESLPAVFYFTAVWCGPCRFIWPEIKKLSESLPNVKFYKIDIDEVFRFAYGKNNGPGFEGGAVGTMEISGLCCKMVMAYGHALQCDDEDPVGGGSALSKLNIFSVPTLHFFKNGKKAAEVVGADARKIKDVSSSLYE